MPKLRKLSILSFGFDPVLEDAIELIFSIYIEIFQRIKDINKSIKITAITDFSQFMFSDHVWRKRK